MQWCQGTRVICTVQLVWLHYYCTLGLLKYLVFAHAREKAKTNYISQLPLVSDHEKHADIPKTFGRDCIMSFIPRQCL